MVLLLGILKYQTRFQWLTRGRFKRLINVSQFLHTKYTYDSAIGNVLKHWSRRFEDEGIPEPVESIEHIVANVIKTNKTMDLVDIHERKLTTEQLEQLESMCECRLSRMPVQYIIGEWDFRDITLKLVPPVFIPRPETEILVDYILKRMYSAKELQNCKTLEIGCGSGAISLALLHACDKIRIAAIDRNGYACQLAKENAKKLGLDDRITIVNALLEETGTVRVSDNSTLTGVDFENDRFDFIVSNPPYIPTATVFDLAPEIKIYEDIQALDGGKDGLNVIKSLLKYAAKALKPGGRLFLEVDPSHPEYIQYFTKKYSGLGLKHDNTYKDFCNNDRFVEVEKQCITA